jgi:hypothetical protein
MKERHHTSWSRLVAAARRAPASSGSGVFIAPSGFVTRVVARAGVRAAGAGGLFGSGFERLAARALGLACACALGFAVWGTLPATAEARSTESAADAYLDPVGDYLAVVQSS